MHPVEPVVLAGRYVRLEPLAPEHVGLRAITDGFDFLPDDVFGYSVITRNQSSFNAANRLEEALDVVPALPGDERFASQVFSRADLTEFWAGASWAREIVDHVAFGATFFGSLRDQSRSRSARLLAIGEGQAASSTFLEDVSYIHVRGLFKMGIAGSWERVDAGVTVTTPSFALYGDGEVSAELSGLAAVSGATDSLVIADREDGLDADYESPLSVAFGVEVRPIERVRLTAAVEWFDGVAVYDVVKGPAPEEVLVEVPAGVELDRDLLTVTDSARSVVNFGFGLGVDVTEQLSAYASWRKDRSSAEGDAANDFRLAVGDWDLDHVIAGGTYRLESSQLAVGVQYSWGGAPTGQFIDASGDRSLGSPLLFADGGTADGDYDALTVIVGYTYFFE